MENIYLNVAGYTVKIIFYGIAEEREAAFMKTIKDIYSGFLMSLEPKRTDYIIEIKNQERYETFLKDHGKECYVILYKENGRGRIITYYHLSLAQFQIVLRKVYQELIYKRGGMIFHASSVEFHNQALLFLGKSGAGKSTCVTLLKERMKVLGDDSVIVTQKIKDHYLYQTPLVERNSWFKKNSNSYKIRKVFFLNQSDQNSLEKIDDKNLILEKLLEQFFSDEKHLRYQFKTVADFVNNFDAFYFLNFTNRDKENFVKFIEANG